MCSACVLIAARSKIGLMVFSASRELIQSIWKTSEAALVALVFAWVAFKWGL